MADEKTSGATGADTLSADVASGDAAAGDASAERERAFEGLEGSRLAKKAAELGASEPGVHADPRSGETTEGAGSSRTRTLLPIALVITGAAVIWRILSRRRAHPS
ncbi:MAG: hypothetical protein KatS3mg008_1904 [Acidimicrobiales bacterium]|nr:MAG: hypothetical protein KatS3mg008_1904 [Acidimicrobiales bacterium]